MNRRTFLKNLFGMFIFLSFDFLPNRDKKERKELSKRKNARYWLYGSRESGCTGQTNQPPFNLRVFE